MSTLSNIDSVILGYVVEVLSSLGEEDTSFDVDELTEMIAAYVPEFAEIDRYSVFLSNEGTRVYPLSSFDVIGRILIAYVESHPPPPPGYLGFCFPLPPSPPNL